MCNARLRTRVANGGNNNQAKDNKANTQVTNGGNSHQVKDNKANAQDSNLKDNKPKDNNKAKLFQNHSSSNYQGNSLGIYHQLGFCFVLDKEILPITQASGFH